MKNLLANIKIQSLAHGLWEAVITLGCLLLAAGPDLLNNNDVTTNLDEVGIKTIALRSLIAILAAVASFAHFSPTVKLNEFFTKYGFKDQGDFENKVVEFNNAIKYIKELNNTPKVDTVNTTTTTDTNVTVPQNYPETPSNVDNTSRVEDLPMLNADLRQLSGESELPTN